jgi:hypothetical protein
MQNGGESREPRLCSTAAAELNRTSLPRRQIRRGRFEMALLDSERAGGSRGNPTLALNMYVHLGKDDEGIGRGALMGAA